MPFYKLFYPFLNSCLRQIASFREMIWKFNLFLCNDFSDNLIYETTGIIRTCLVAIRHPDSNDSSLCSFFLLLRMTLSVFSAVAMDKSNSVRGETKESTEMGVSHSNLHMLLEDRKQMRPQNSFIMISLQNPRIHCTCLSNLMLGSNTYKQTIRNNGVRLNYGLF